MAGSSERGPDDWDLSGRRANLARAAELCGHPAETVRDFPSARLLVRAGSVGGQIGLVSKLTGLLEHYVQYETATHPALGRCAVRVRLWRSRFASVRGTAAMALDATLLARFDTLVSDAVRTDRGREFWEVQISAHAASKTVGLIAGGEVLCHDRAAPIEDWLARRDGRHEERRVRRRCFFVSNLPRDEIEAAVGPSEAGGRGSAEGR